MKELLNLLVNLIVKLLKSSTETQSSVPTPISNASQILSDQSKDIIVAEGVKLSAYFAENFGHWSEKDKELAKRVAVLSAIKVHDLNAQELLEYSALLDKASELSSGQSIMLNEFKSKFFNTVETVVTKIGTIGSKIAVGALIALI